MHGVPVTNTINLFIYMHAMDPCYAISVCLMIFIEFVIISCKAAIVPFNQYYVPAWGGDHVIVLNQGRQVDIKLDQYSGGGFISKQAFGSGLFQLNLKIPRNSEGAVTTIYLTSDPSNKSVGGIHDELDFELLGHNGPPYILNTNVFAQDSGNREQQFKLWFDPTLDFHSYEILWNSNQVVFFVDRLPIRVFKNHRDRGVRFPILPMYVETSLWNGTQWLGPVNWSLGPFLATYRDFSVNGCPYDKSNPTKCYSSSYVWNHYGKLTVQQEKTLQDMRTKHLIYDYCNSASANRFPECRIR